MITLTVAIPSYNKEKYIERCIKSILKDKRYINQIILVDNASTDNTLKIAEDFKPDIECHQNEKNLGMSPNFNKCIELCRSEWLMILHADDELVPESIPKYLALIEKYPSLGIIHANSYSVTNGDESTKNLATLKCRPHWKAGADALSCNYGVCSAVMVKKEVYDKLGGFIESSMSSDVEMWSRIASNFDVGFINEPTVIYHVNPSSTGPQSLVNRSVREIKADWDLLAEKISLGYPTKELKDAFLKKNYESAPYSYWAVVKANLRAKNYRNVFSALWLIIFTYKGLLPLIKILWNLLIKHINRLHESSRKRS